MKQLIYRQERNAPFEALAAVEFQFCRMSRLSEMLRMFNPLRKAMGMGSALKSLIKVGTPARQLYCVICDRKVVHFGWLSLSFCKYYQVDPRSVVIGPVTTMQGQRRLGAGTFGVKSVVNAMMAEGYRVFYIDASEDNVASRRLIAKCGFGSPVDSYERTE
jgi:hypothetical protein